METLPSYADLLYADIKPSYSDSLMHHGIKGMHWGVRRYQNPDGSLTTAGRERYLSSKGFSKSSSTEKYDLQMAAKNAGIKINRHDTISYHDIRNNPNYDSKTGLVLKTKKMSSEEDAAMVNPRAANSTLFHSNREYYVNCTHCTAAYDMRKRGYDVAATSASGFGERISTVRKFYPGAEERRTDPVIKSKNFVDWAADDASDEAIVSLWQESYMHALFNSPDYTKKCKEQGAQILKTCESYGPNARGNVLLRIACGGGHSIAFENDSKGNTRFVDSQTVSVNRNASMGGKDSAYYKRLINCADPYFSAQVIRYDNATPDINYMLNNNVISNPKTVTVTHNNGESQDFKMYQYSSK